MAGAPLWGLCRVTVVAPTARADLALAAAVPVAALLPVLLRELGDAYGGPHARAGWQLCDVTGRPLAPGGTLAAGGVLDGDVLVLQPAAPSPSPPLIDDAVDALATEPYPASAAAARTARAVLGTLAAAVGAAAVLRLPWAGSHGVLVLGAGVVAIVGALRRRPVVAAAGVGVAAIGAQAVPGGMPAVARLALGCGVATACCAGLLAVPAAATVRACWLGAALATGLVAVASSASIVHAGLDAPLLVRAAAGTAVLAVAMSTRLPRLALRLAGVRRPSSGTDVDDGPLAGTQAGGDPLARAQAARALLAGATTGVSAALVLAAAALALAPDPSARGLGMLAAVLAMLRGRLFRPAVAVLTGVLGGAAALAAGALAGVAGGGVLWSAPVAAGAIVVAWASLGGPSTDPRWGRAAEAAEVALVVALVPLTLLAVGAFDAVGR